MWPADRSRKLISLRVAWCREPFFRLHCESCPNLEHLLALSAAHQVLRDIAKVDNNRVPSQQENGTLTTVAHLHIGQPCRKEKGFLVTPSAEVLFTRLFQSHGCSLMLFASTRIQVLDVALHNFLLCPINKSALKEDGWSHCEGRE